MAGDSQTPNDASTRYSPLGIDQLLNPAPLTLITTPARMNATKSGLSKEKRSREDASLPSERFLDWYETNDDFDSPYITSTKNKRRRKGDIVGTSVAYSGHFETPGSNVQAGFTNRSKIVAGYNQLQNPAQLPTGYGNDQLTDETRASWYANAIYDEKTGNFKLPNGRLLVIPQNHYGQYPDQDSVENEWSRFGWEPWTPSNDEAVPDDPNEILAYEREAYNCLADMSAIAPFETAANNMAKSAGYFIQGHLYTAQNIKNAAKRAVQAMLKVHHNGCTEGPYVDISFDKGSKKHVTKKEATKRMLKLYDSNMMTLVDDAEAEVTSYHLMSFRKRFATWCEVVKTDKKVVVDLLNGEIEPVKLVVAPELLTEKKAGYKSTNRGRAEVLAMGQAVKKQTSGTLRNICAAPPENTGRSEMYFPSLEGNSVTVPTSQSSVPQTTIALFKTNENGVRRSSSPRKKRIPPPSPIQVVQDPDTATQPTSPMVPTHSWRPSGHLIDSEHRMATPAESWVFRDSPVVIAQPSGTLTDTSVENGFREPMSYTHLPSDIANNGQDLAFGEIVGPIGNVMRPRYSVTHIPLPSIDQWYFPDITLPINESHLAGDSQTGQEGYTNHSHWALNPTLLNGDKSYGSLHTSAGATTSSYQPISPVTVVKDRPSYTSSKHDLSSLDDSVLDTAIERGHVEWTSNEGNNDNGCLGVMSNTRRDTMS